MKVRIRMYQDCDKAFLVKYMNGMQKQMYPFDPLKKIRHFSNFNAEKYVENFLKKVKKTKGAIFIAESHAKKIGCIVGILKKPTKDDLIDILPFINGRIVELYVDSSFRGKNVGSQLLEKMEFFFKKNGCEASELGCFRANIMAYKFYKQHAYIDRYIDLCKRL